MDKKEQEIEYVAKNDVLNASRIVYVEYIELDDYEEAECDTIPIILKKDVEKLPAAAVRPLEHGEWINIKYGIWNTIYADCTHCKRNIVMNQYESRNFCPHCGASMLN